MTYRVLAIGMLVLAMGALGARPAFANGRGSSRTPSARKAARKKAQTSQGERLTARERARAALDGRLTRRGVTREGETIDRLQGGKRLGLSERREIAVEAVKERLMSDGRIDGAGRELHVFASLIDRAASANPITGDGLVTVYARENPAGFFDRNRYRRILVSVSADGSEVRILSIDSRVPHARFLRALRLLGVNEIVADLISSKGARSAASLVGLGLVGVGFGLEAFGLGSESALAAAAGGFAVGGGGKGVLAGIRRRREARKAALTDAVRWAKREGIKGPGFPTLGDTYARYLHTLEENKPGTFPWSMVRFAEALRREWNGVKLEPVE